MKKILLLFSLAIMLGSCGASKDSSIEVVAYQWSATLDNSTTAKGTETTEGEAKNAIKVLSKAFDSKVSSSKVKKVKLNVKKSKF